MPPRTVVHAGEKHWKLTFVKPDPRGKTKKHWICKCECGKKVSRLPSAVVSGRSKSCGCFRWLTDKRNPVVNVGATFGRLTVRKKVRKHVRWRGEVKLETYWECECSCGNTKVIHPNELRIGKTQSCGCLHKERVSKHGYHSYPEYLTWKFTLDKCTKPTSVGYKTFGAKGITIDPSWKDFETFLKDVGRKPFKDSYLRRKDTTKGFTKDNVYWCEMKYPSSKLITIDDETKTLAEWAEESGVNKNTIKTRMSRGWDAKKAVFHKSRKLRTTKHSSTKYCDCGKVASIKFGSDWICQSCEDLMKTPIKDVVGVRETHEKFEFNNKKMTAKMLELGVPEGKLSDTELISSNY